VYSSDAAISLEELKKMTVYSKRQVDKGRQLLLIVSVTTAMMLGLFFLIVHIFGWAWTGFGSAVGPELRPNQQYRPEKTLWDWMQLFLVPLVLAALGIWFNWSQKQREQWIADDARRETTLENYQSQMADLILHERLSVRKKVRRVASTKTLIALQRLDGQRRAIILRYLYESRLIDREDTIVDLRGTILNENHQWFYATSKRGDVAALAMTGANLEDIDLRGANLEKAGLDGVNLRHANLRGAHLWEAQLNGANLSEVDLRWANLGGAGLRKAVFAGTQLSHASLRGSDLTGVDLRGVIWGEGADLSHAKLLGAIVDDLVLSRARLEQADMGSAVNRDTPPPPVFQELTMSDSILGKAEGPMLEGACLMSCSLRGVDLRKANLRGADLTDARLENADLSRADLREANLDGTDLCYANLRAAIVSDEQLAKAQSIRAATMPDGSKHG